MYAYFGYFAYNQLVFLRVVEFMSNSQFATTNASNKKTFQ